MKTFNEFVAAIDIDEETYKRSVLDEANYTSTHYRSASQMAMLHKNVLKANNHTIVSHETDGQGAHHIVHITPSKKVRKTTITPVHSSGRKQSTIHDRPGTAEEHAKYGPKK